MYRTVHSLFYINEWEKAYPDIATWNIKLDTVEADLEGGDLLELAAWCAHREELISHWLNLTRELEVVLLLGNEGVIQSGEVEALVSRHDKARRIQFL